MEVNMNALLEKALASRWIAGYHLEDAIELTEKLNSKGMSTLINFLGEDALERQQIKEAVKTYAKLIKEIKIKKLDASISIKLTQIGLSIDYQTMLPNYTKIVKLAKKNNIFVWLDMEEPKFIDQTIKAYGTVSKHNNTGICIQAYLKRSKSDVEALIKKKAKIRLVKGAYHLSPETALKTKREINHNYLQIMRMLFERSNNFMIATHDSKIIKQAINLNKKYKRNIIFAMLNGIRNRYAEHLVEKRMNFAMYVPFGKDWIGFSYRRLTEQKHLLLILRSLFENQTI
jgi:proline dehydrogenase